MMNQISVHVYPDINARRDSIYILLAPSNTRDPEVMRELLHKAMLEIALGNYSISVWNESESAPWEEE